MSKLTQYVRHLAVVAIATLLAQCAWADKVISIDLQSAKVSGGDMSGETAYGLVPVPGSAWTNDGCSYANNNANKNEDLSVIVKEYDTTAGTTTDLSSDVVLHMNVKNAYYWTTATDPFLKAYADDSAQPIISVKNVPYSKYTVIVYCATDSDNKQFGPVTVNGTPYKYDAETGAAVVASGSTSTADTRWGQCHSLTAVEGTNAIRITGQAGKTLTVMGGTNANGARGGLAGLQIIEEAAVVDNVDGGSAYSTASLPAEADVINLTMNDGGVITIAAAMTKNVNVICSGSVKFVSDEGYAYTTADLAKFDVSGVTGSAVRVIDTAAIPEGLAAPTTGWTYRYEGTTALAALPFGNADSFTGKIEIACPVTTKNSEEAWATLPVHNNKSYIFAEDAAIECNNFQTGNGGGSVESFVQKGGSITANSSDTGNTTSAAFLLAHWGSGCAVSYTLNNGSISVPNGGIRLGWDGDGTLTQNGGTVTAKGLRANRDGHSGRGTYNLNGGTLTLGANGIDFGSTGSLVLGGGKIIASETATMTLDAGLAIPVETMIEVAEGKTLTINAVLSGTADLVKTGAGTLIISKVPNGYTGAIRITEGALDVQGNRNLQNVVFATGTTLVARETTADDGVMTITGVSGTPTIKLYNALGEEIPSGSISVEGTTITATFTPTVAGKGCWMDYEFKGDMTSVGTDTTALSRDGSDFGSDASSDFKVDEEGNAYALYTGTHPYRGITYPTEWSCAIYCSVPDYAKAALITFGTRGNGLIGLIAGAEKDQVLLVRTTGDSAYEVLATMAVPNAATAQHLYTFSKTAREIKVYLDGKLWTTYTSQSDITFGGGMQIASVHGGVGSTGIVRFDKVLFNNDTENETLRKSLIGMMRLYNSVLGPNAAKALSDEFPYVSPNGLYTREVSEDGTWSQEDAWSKVLESGSEAAAIPEEGAVVKIATASDETVAKITVNVESDMTTEELAITGGGIIAFDVAEGSGKISNSGATTIDAAVTIKYGALDISGGPLTLGPNGSVAFDFSACPIATAYNPETVFFTGITERNDDLITAKVPSPDHGRALTFEYDTATQRYVGVLDMEREAGDLAIGEGDVTITDSTVYTDADGNETVRFFADDWIVVSHEQTLTITENLTYPAKIKVVEGGVLTLNFGSDVTKTGNTYNATVRVEAGGVYDLAYATGHADYSHPIVLAGGTLTNSGIESGVGSRQYWQNSVVAGSTIDVPGNEFGAVNAGHAAHDYNLGGNVLTKTGAGQFTFKTANFVGGGTLAVEEGTFILDSCTVPEGATLDFVVASGATIIVKGNNPLAKTGTVTGSGTVIYENGVDTSAIYQDTGWTGTLWIKGMNWNDWDLGREGTAGSSQVKLTGFTGYAPNNTSAGCNATVELADNGNTKAVSVNNGYSTGAFFFKKIIGSGTFTATSANTSKHIYKFHDVSEFTGKLEANNIRIVVGNGNVGDDAGTMAFTDGVNINGGLNWSAAKVVFGNTLKVKGAVGDAIVTATTLPETMPSVTLVDGETETTGYTLVNDNGTLKVALAAVTVTLPVPSNTEITSVTAGGETVTLTDGAITVAPGTEVVVTYAAIGNNIGGGTVTVTIDADTTTDSIDVSGITTVAAVAKIGDAKYETLVAALNAAAEGATITLVADDSSITTRYQLTKSVTINLNGKNVTASERIVVSNNAILTVNAEGSTISGLRIDAGKNSNDCGNIIINKGTWTANEEDTVFHVNGTCTSANVTITGATITSPTDNGIQLNGKGDHTITDCTITGATAVYVKGGDVTINGATKLVATGSHVDVTINNNGSNATGDAIVFEAAETTYQAIGTITIADTVKFESKNGSAALSYARENNTRRTKFLPAALKSNITESIATSADLFDDYTEGPQSWTDVTEETKVTDIVSSETAAKLTGSTVTAKNIADWATALADKGVTVDLHATIPVNALILNCAPTSDAMTAAENAVVVDEATIDAIMAAVAAGTDPTKIEIPAEVKAQYPMAKIELVESTKIQSTGTAKFFQLKLTLK